MAANTNKPKNQYTMDPKQADYVKTLQAEKEKMDDEATPNAARLLTDEIDRVQTGRDLNKLLELHHAKPMKLAVKVLIPVKQFPKFNFVGKLLGPKGNTLKRLQEETGTKMAILGRGSMRDKQKEEELRKEGGKYSHLNDDLHALVEFFGLPAECHSRVAHALGELRAYLIPEENDEIRAQQMEEMYFINGDNPGGGPPGPNGSGPRGRGRGRGAPPPGMGRGGPPPPPGGPGALLATPGPRGGPGGPPPPSRGGMGRSAPPPMGRAAPPPPPMGRAAPPPMGRGSAGSRPPAPGRGAPPGRAPPSRPREAYSSQDSYYQPPPSSNYPEESYSYEEPTEYSDPYAQSSYPPPTTAQETEYYDYGHGAAQEESYGSHGGHGDYSKHAGESWSQQPSSTYGKAPAPRARSSMPDRSHPYAAATAPRTARY